MSYNLPLRLKRLRKTSSSRALLQETHLNIEQFIAPLFIVEGLETKKPIVSMPGQFQLSLSDLAAEIDELTHLGIQAVLLFGIPKHKDEQGSSSFSEQGIIQQAIQRIRSHNPEILIISDVCFCEYTSHGHCGTLENQCINNDKTLDLLVQQAVSHAKAGADWVAPSGMTDGMVKAMRTGLDAAGYSECAILSYSVKYCSSLYGPFRDAAQGAPQFGNRQSYQMNPANSEEAIREAMLDIQEGADLIMVKPASFYLDIIYKLKQRFPEVPLCAYQVSGEYSMLKFAAQAGILDEQQAMIESLLAIKRAGANLIITYFAKDMGRLLKSTE